MYKIFYVEDDTKIRSLVTESLKKYGFDVYATDNFENILSDFSKINPQLVLLDINLPVFDGFYWCQKIREVSKLPVIFVSSRNTNMDIVMAMNMGGDDFIQKPFSMEVLIAKIQAVLRRSYSYQNTDTQVIEYNGIVLNMNSHDLIYHDQKLELTKNEYLIMVLLLKSHGKILSRDEIMKALWEDESFVDDNTLTVNINRLRKKLSSIGLNEVILTKKGQGYVIS